MKDGAITETEVESTEIVKKENPLQESGITAANIEEKIKAAEVWVDYVKRMRAVALKATSPGDWIMHGDKPYCQDNGVTAILRTIGAETHGLRIEEEVKHDANGRKDYYYTAIGKISFHGKTYENMGGSSTRDQFFSMRNKKLIPVEELDLEDIKKKSVTNLKHRLLNDAIGLNPTLEDLEKIGIKPGAAIKYSKGNKGGTVDSKEEVTMRAELRESVLKIADVTEKDPHAILQSITTFTKDGKEFPGYQLVEKVSVRMLKQTLSKAKKKLQEANAGS